MLQDDEFYFENGLMVFTSTYHRRRGECCGSGCRHCPYKHAKVPAERRRMLPAPQPYYPDGEPGEVG